MTRSNVPTCLILGTTLCLFFSAALSLSIGRSAKAPAAAIETDSNGTGEQEQLLTPPRAADVDKLRTSTHHSCDHLLEPNQNKTEKFEVCCAGFAFGTWDCTKEPQVGHACTAVQAPACCKCSHLPPLPTTVTPTPDADDDDDESKEEDDATDEKDDEEEEEDEEEDEEE